ncbi:MAG: hypothetical protein PVH29_03830 [Candidatus Zixiibacteriota bacterium]|jgi:hypothetical protein
MKKTLLWILFFLFLALIISPLDLAPGPIDDVIYGIINMIIVALLGFSPDKKKKKELPPSEEGESSVIDEER